MNNPLVSNTGAIPRHCDSSDRFGALIRVGAILSLWLVTSIPPALAVSTTADEQAEARRWVAAKLEANPKAKPHDGYLSVSFKSGQVLKNRATTKVYHIDVGNLPLRIADRTYTRGLYCPSEGQIVVHLPGPGKSFEAIVGVDSSRATSFYSNAGQGNVLARVKVGGDVAFRSSAMKEGMPGAPVAVDLKGATEFVLELTDAGGGIIQGVDYNQADWAEARVTLADGRTLWLGDLPVGPLRAEVTTEPPFSFQYGGKSSRDFLKTWERKHSIRKVNENEVEHTLIFRDPATGLQVRCAGTEYKNFPVLEWTLYFTNTSDKATPILENILGLDTTFERDNEGEFVLHHNEGSPHSIVTMSGPTDYRPLETRLGRGSDKTVGAKIGLPATKDFPFFNVEWAGKGVILAVGWPGQWAGRFKRDNDRKLQVSAGQELTRFKLLPGEEVRSTRIAMLFWEGDWLRGQNLWRRWMMAHNMPRPGGKLPPPQVAGGSSAYYVEMSQADEQSQFTFIDRYAEERIKFDYWWVDAGWHVFKDYWLNIGTWEPDPKRFPKGLRPLSDKLQAQNKKMILWFAPEAATPGTLIYNKPPDWLLGRDDERFKLVNLGNPAAREWLTDYIDKTIKEQGASLYRHDGIPPLSYWRANEPEDRQGIIENHYVQGYLAYWDELRRRNPNMVTDICAGGGGRNDLEGLRRAVPLWRSDYAYETTGMQNLTYGMALWVPYFGSGVSEYDMYACRSQMAPALSCIWDLRNRKLNYDFARKFLDQWRQISDYYYGDFYPLTTYRTENDIWMAWQFNVPESGEGMVQSFRRPMSDVTTMRLRLRGLDPAARYSVTNLDLANSGGQSLPFWGSELMEKGLPVTLPAKPESGLHVYKRVQGH